MINASATARVKANYERDMKRIRIETFKDLFYHVIIICLCLFVLYFMLYKGKYKIEYFLADNNPELTELASGYHQALSQDAEYEIQYILYLPFDWLSLDHNASVQFIHQGETIEIEYKDESLLPGFHAWIDLEEPESIRFYNDYSEDDRYYLSKEAEAVKVSIEKAHEAVRTYLEHKDSWKDVFQIDSDTEAF